MITQNDGSLGLLDRYLNYWHGPPDTSLSVCMRRVVMVMLTDVERLTYFGWDHSLSMGSWTVYMEKESREASKQPCIYFFVSPPFFLNCRFKCDQLLQASATVVAPAMRDCDLELWVELKSPQLSCFCQNIYHRNSKRNQDMCSILFFLYHALDTEPCFLHSFFLFRISTYLFYCWHLGFQFGTNMNICV